MYKILEKKMLTSNICKMVVEARGLQRPPSRGSSS